MKITQIKNNNDGQILKPPPYLLFVGAVVAIVVTAYAYDCNVLTSKPCATLQGACKVGTLDGTITASASMGMCDGGAPGSTICEGNTNKMVNCGYECSYKDTDGQHTRWQTNSIPEPTLSGDDC